MVYGPPSVAFLDLPQLRESVPAHRPLAAAYAVPWPGRVVVWRSPGEDGFELVTTLGRSSRIGRLVADLYPGPTSRFDLGNVAEGVGLRPFSVGHIEQPWRKARVPGDLVIRWTRRSRAPAADSWNAPEVPLAEESEAYEVEILDGAIVRRTLNTSTTSVTYTAAQQIADWGASLRPGDTLDVRIFQLFALVGRGAPASVTLEF